MVQPDSSPPCACGPGGNYRKQMILCNPIDSLQRLTSLLIKLFKTRTLLPSPSLSLKHAVVHFNLFLHSPPCLPNHYHVGLRRRPYPPQLRCIIKLKRHQREDLERRRRPFSSIHHFFNIQSFQHASLCFSSPIWKGSFLPFPFHILFPPPNCRPQIPSPLLLSRQISRLQRFAILLLCLCQFLHFTQQLQCSSQFSFSFTAFLHERIHP